MKRLALFLLLTLLAACGPSPSARVARYVDLNNLQPLPTPLDNEVRPLKIAIAAVISPKGSAESYAPLLDYMSRKLGRPVERVQRRTYSEINELLRTGEVDMAFVCTSSYLIGKDQFDLELLVAPEVKEKTVYYSLLIVPTDSPAESMADLRGQVFAFTDPLSLSGRVYPTYLVQNLGSTPEEFFARTFFTYSHDDAIRAVATKVADGAAVDSLVYDFAVARDPSLAQKTRIIHRSPAFGIPPVVVSPHTRPQLRVELQSLFLKMNEDEEGRAALKAIGVDRFVLIEDGAYDGARLLLSEVQQGH